MITVAQAKKRLGKIYERKSAVWAVHPFKAGEALTVGLQPPNDRQATADMTGVANWIQQWSQVDAPGLRVEWDIRRWPNTGTQRVPIRLLAETPQAVASFLGRRPHWRLRHDRAQRLLRLPVTSALPVRTEFRQAVARVLPKLDAVGVADFDRSFDVLAWLAENPASGLYPRQLPVSGIDSKWLERYAGIIRPLHVARGGSPDLGLCTPPKMYRVRFLDPRLAPGGIRDLSAPVAELAQLPRGANRVLIVENLQTLLSLPPMDGVIALHGAGYDVRWCTELPWIHGVPIVYWGDLDADGLMILAALRGVLPEVRSVMMDTETFQKFADHAVLDPNGPGKQTPGGLNASECAVFEFLRERGGWRLEQERIDWAHALNELFWILCAP